MFAWRILQLPRFPGLIRESAFLQTWVARIPFVPASWRPRPFDLEAFYRWYGYAAADIRLLWAERLAVWILESAILAGYVAAWLTRDRARDVARGFLQVAFPLLLAGVPFAIVMTDYTFDRWMPASSPSHAAWLGAITALLLAGEALNLAGLVSLRRSFTIMTEARTLVRGGVYRFVRHPLYLGQFVTYLGYTLLHLHPAAAALFAFFVAAQVLRARVEECKLAAAFPEYEDYRRTAGMFWPRLGRRAGG